MSVRLEERRSALARLVAGGMAIIGAALAGLVGVVVLPKSGATGRQWRRAVSMFDLPKDRPFSATIAERHADGWYETRRQSVVFIDKDGAGYRALSATCMHLGCRVHWDDTKSQFKCPCHGGTYDRAGHVVSGPPPAPLERLNTRVNPSTGDIEVEL
jgi:Rieske Fe-S protein